MHTWAKLGRISAIVLSLSLLAGCAEDVRKSGYYPLEQDLNAISVGSSTKSDVLATVGSPSLGGLEPGEPVYYIGQRKRFFGPMSPQIVDRQIVVVSFDSRDRVTNVETLGLEDGRIVVISQRITEPLAGRLGFFRQLFGNIGNVDASQLIGS